MFTTTDYLALHRLVFRPDYSGYKPEVKEIPNGDGKVDADKRFAHVAPKYFTTEEQAEALMPYLEYAHGQAVYAALKAGISDRWLPDIRYGALRIIDYPPGAVSNAHEDFDLFTLMMYRDQPDRFLGAGETTSRILSAIREVSPQAHIGQLGEAVGLGLATPHSVLASERTQRSIVYFAIPDHDNKLPHSDVTVREWLNERMARSRTEFKKYE